MKIMSCCTGYATDHSSSTKLKGRCSICNVRDYCKGCRRIAHFMTGDFYAADPGCLQAMSEQAAIEGQAK